MIQDVLVSLYQFLVGAFSLHLQNYGDVYCPSTAMYSTLNLLSASLKSSQTLDVIY